MSAVVFSPDGRWVATQTGNWLDLCEQASNRRRPIANRHLPVIWPGTLRFLPPEARCQRCVEIVRDVPENLLKLERINFDDYPAPPAGTKWNFSLAEWSAKLGLTFDPQGRIVPLENTSR